MNNKGFTLIELIAMLTVLGILMAITVPNMTGILTQQKEGAYVEAAEQLISTAEMKVLTNKKIKNPKDGNCIVLSMNYLDKASELKKSADGGEYIREESFVFISRVGAKYKYYVRLVETTPSGEVYGIDTVEKSVLAKERTNLIGVAVNMGYNMHIATPDSLSSMEPFIVTCTEIEAVYN